MYRTLKILCSPSTTTDRFPKIAVQEFETAYSSHSFNGHHFDSRRAYSNKVYLYFEDVPAQILLRISIESVKSKTASVPQPPDLLFQEISQRGHWRYGLDYFIVAYFYTSTLDRPDSFGTLTGIK
jgi:hypothetical protein